MNTTFALVTEEEPVTTCPTRAIRDLAVAYADVKQLAMRLDILSTPSERRQGVLDQMHRAATKLAIAQNETGVELLSSETLADYL